ncbi:polymorphic toxin-type HINT domain-containing protein [Tuwongella immobilis]|uniref:polymorphic toxin-type HINT domain-containing protein n=1 Tax=Tuwongella immobilis TaxID=692036 RepID=UPI0013A6E5A1|nr:polymorphic toxin-type HINT domain-containing protein [Tuwongella immobilis]
MGSRQLIETTAEHPFWIVGRSWTSVWELSKGDCLTTITGETVSVEGVHETDRRQTVYNLRVSDFHTDFVGCDEWGYSVWAHHAECAILYQRGDTWYLRGKGSNTVLKEGTVSDVRAYATANGHEITVPKAGESFSPEHRAADSQAYLDKFKPGGENYGKTLTCPQKVVQSL